MESNSDGEAIGNKPADFEVYNREVERARVEHTRQRRRAEIGDAELIDCRDCAFCYAVDYEYCGKSRIMHECRKDAPLILFHETTWPVINIESGCCGSGRKKRKLPKKD